MKVTFNEENLDNSLKKLLEISEKLGFRFKSYSIIDNYFERKNEAENLTERLEWRGDGKIIKLDYTCERSGHEAHYNDGVLDLNLNPLNPVAVEILEKIGYDEGC